jgi:hypothetical protein
LLLMGALVAGCSTPMPQRIEVSTTPIEKPSLILPDATVLRLNDVEWIVITKENAAEVFAELESSRKDAALVGLTAEGYAVLSTNYGDIMAYIQQQNAIIAAYKNYYEESEQAIEEANGQLNSVENAVETQQQQEETKPIWKLW